jgi:hypothetical protein
MKSSSSDAFPGCQHSNVAVKLTIAINLDWSPMAGIFDMDGVIVDNQNGEHPNKHLSQFTGMLWASSSTSSAAVLKQAPT